MKCFISSWYGLISINVKMFYFLVAWAYINLKINFIVVYGYINVKCLFPGGVGLYQCKMFYFLVVWVYINVKCFISWWCGFISM